MVIVTIVVLSKSIFANFNLVPGENDAIQNNIDNGTFTYNMPKRLAVSHRNPEIIPKWDQAHSRPNVKSKSLGLPGFRCMNVANPHFTPC